jgi:hypothetical protein
LLPAPKAPEVEIPNVEIKHEGLAPLSAEEAWSAVRGRIAERTAALALLKEADAALAAAVAEARSTSKSV